MTGVDKVATLGSLAAEVLVTHEPTTGKEVVLARGILALIEEINYLHEYIDWLQTEC